MMSQLIIVPNEEYVSDEVWSVNLVDENDRHGKRIYEYSNIHKLGLTFENVGVPNNNFNGYFWGCALAKLSYLSLHTDKNENIVIYVPDIISKNQYKFLKKHYRFIASFHNVSTCFIKCENGEFMVDDTKDISLDMDCSPSIKKFYKYLDEKYKVDDKEKVISK